MDVPRVQSLRVLFFEFFPLFVMIAGTMTAIWLFVLNTRVRNDPTEEDAQRRLEERWAADARRRANATPEPTIVRRPSFR
jgi:hypothetical protein